MYPNRFKKGKPPVPHKPGCQCFRCTGVVWNKGVSTAHIIGEKISKSLIGTERRRGKYKDKHITYSGIHKWIGKRLPNKGICNNCQKEGKTEVSNNIGIGRNNFDEKAKQYGEKLRDLSIWEWLCHRCHGFKDGFIYNRRGTGKLTML